MGYVAQMSILDGQATPVAHLYKRLPTVANGTIAFRDSTSGLVIAAKSLFTGSYRPAASNNAGAKRTWNFTFPDYDAVTKKVIASGSIRIEYLLPDNLSLTVKKDMAAMLKNFSASAEVQAEFTADDPVI